MGATFPSVGCGGATRSIPMSSLASPSTSSVSSSRSPPLVEQYRRCIPKRSLRRQRPEKGDLPSQEVALCLVSRGTPAAMRFPLESSRRQHCSALTTIQLMLRKIHVFRCAPIGINGLLTCVTSTKRQRTSSFSLILQNVCSESSSQKARHTNAAQQNARVQPTTTFTRSRQ